MYVSLSTWEKWKSRHIERLVMKQKKEKHVDQNLEDEWQTADYKGKIPTHQPRTTKMIHEGWSKCLNS